MMTAGKLMEMRIKEGNRIVESETPDHIRRFVEKTDFDHPDFSIREFVKGPLTESIVHARRIGYMEATPTGAVGQLLRADTQRIMDNWFSENLADLSYTQVCATVNSNKRQEFYNPVHSAVVLAKTPEGTPYPDNAIRAEDVVLVNQKLMGGESFTRELWDDDQTGQIRQRQNDLSEAAMRTFEIYFALRFIGTAGTFGPLSVPASNWTTFTTSTNEFGTAITSLFTVRTGVTGLGNRVATLGQLSTPRLKEAQQLLSQMRDLQGNRMGYKPDTLLISPFDEVNAAIIANSAYYPVTIGKGAETASTAVAGFAGQVFSSNPWKGLFRPVVNRYLADWAWALGMRARGIVFQIRDAVQVVQENPTAGQSFDQDVIRLRVRTRYEIDWTDPRPWVLGNDGSFAGTF